MGNFVCTNHGCSKHLQNFVSYVSAHCPRCNHEGTSTADIEARNLEVERAGAILATKLAGCAVMLEKYYLIQAFTNEQGDQWEDFMGEDTLVFFCEDCAELLPLYLVGELCPKCNDNYNELWGK